MSKLRVLFAQMQDEKAEGFHPLWPGYLASFAEKLYGTETFEFRLCYQQISDEINRFSPHLVAIGTDSRGFDEAVRCAQTAKIHKLPVVIGGVHISALPECLTDDMDVACVGEGEETFAQLLGHLLEFGSFKKEGLGGVKGIAYRTRGDLLRTDIRPQIAPYEKIPHPKRSLTGYLWSDYVLASRGCAYHCRFCSSRSYWGRARYASPAYILEEIHELVEHGTKIIRFEDDSLTTNVSRLRDLAELIVRSKLERRVQFSCWARANEVTKEIARTLKEMNVRTVWMGLESGSQRTLDFLKGGVKVGQNRRAIELLKSEGLRINGFFVIGAPKETEAEILQTYRFARESHLDHVTLNVLTPLPGTVCWDQWANKPSQDKFEWARLFSKQNPYILSEGISRDKLLRLCGEFAHLEARKWRKSLLRRLYNVADYPILAHNGMRLFLRYARGLISGIFHLK